MVIEHSILPPSSAARRMACPGSRAMEASAPDDNDSPHAREGEAAHWVAEQLLRGNDTSEWTRAPNDEPITEEMREGAQIYGDYIKQWVAGDKEKAFFIEEDKLYIKHALPSIIDLHIEETVPLTLFHPDAFGTPDCWLVNDLTLHVFDYKFGHRYVEVEENWQLVAYASGILRMLPNEPIDSIYLHIVQPRCFHPEGALRSWCLTERAFRSYEAQLIASEHRSLEYNAPCQPNPLCRTCNARHLCTALQRTALETVTMSLQNVPVNLSGEQLGRELRVLEQAADLLEARITGLAQEAFTLAKKGENIAGYMLQETNGRTRWKTSVNEVITLGELLGVNLKKPNDVLTPRQAAKLLPQEVIDTYTETTSGTVKLVPVDTKRSQKIFGGNNE
jgi:hypothetical protein